MKMKIMLGIFLSLLGIALITFWHQALVEFSVLGNSTSLPQTRDQVRLSFQTFSLACSVTGINPLPPSGGYDAGQFFLAILRRLFPGLVLGYVAVVAGGWMLLSAFLNQRFKRTHIVLNILTIGVMAVLVVNGLKTCLIGPSGTIRSFGETANKMPEDTARQLADPQH